MGTDNRAGANPRFARADAKALQAENVPAVVAQRRDDFLSPEFRWLVACLVQVLRPLDNRNIGVLVEAFNRIAGIEIAVDQIIADAEATGESYFSIWLRAARAEAGGSPQNRMLESIGQLTLDPSAAK